MSDENAKSSLSEDKIAPQTPSPAAARALAEAAARRKAAVAGEHSDAAPPVEKDGRGGLDPVRFGDWEVKGIASDF